MPAIAKEKQKEIRERIRVLIVRRPDLSLREIQEMLDKSARPIHLGIDYISKQIEKIRNDRQARFDRYTLKGVIGNLEEEYKLMKNELWNILVDQSSTKGEKMMAIRELSNLDERITQMYFDSGILEKKLGTLNINERKMDIKVLVNLLDDENKAKIIEKAATALKTLQRGEAAKNNGQGEVAEISGNRLLASESVRP